MKGIAKRLANANVTLSGKQKKMPGSVQAPSYKVPTKRTEKGILIPKKVRNKVAIKKTSRA